jgi:hypothetical protein
VSSDVYVVFTGDDGHWWSPFLHPVIKHCYILVPDRGRWIIYGKSEQYFDLFTLDDQPFKLEQVIVVKAERKQIKRGLFMLNTCVGHAKQILGINDPFILTPYQLYKRLKHA